MVNKSDSIAMAIFQLLPTICLAIGLTMEAHRSETNRQNAMDLCAWHARRNYGDVSSPEATQVWRDIVKGERVCSFCGQKHDDNWKSKNAWQSMLGSMSNAESIK